MYCTSRTAWRQPISPVDPVAAKKVSTWLFACSGAVFGMVVIGGVTRLTRSGLSMTDWKFAGSMPPRDIQAWEEEFNRYKQFPEYTAVNSSMTLSEFKRIWYMEWAHRMWGRGLGFAFALPATYFAWKGYLPSPLKRRLGLLFLMGGSQGFVGWWMVRSGLQKPDPLDLALSNREPRVSPYRLAAHLMSAFAIYGVLLTTGLQVYLPHSNEPLRSHYMTSLRAPHRLRLFAMGTCAMVGLTAYSGAFVAGNDAGKCYNEFPLMGGRWIPQDIVDPYLKPAWRNVFENASLVQWEHRLLAMTTLCSTVALFAMTRRIPSANPLLVKVTGAVAGMATVQASLGISTLLMYVPVNLAATHQAGSLSLLTVAIFMMHLV